jgi:hypothetical protein
MKKWSCSSTTIDVKLCFLFVILSKDAILQHFFLGQRCTISSIDTKNKQSVDLALLKRILYFYAYIMLHIDSCIFFNYFLFTKSKNCMFYEHYVVPKVLNNVRRGIYDGAFAQDLKYFRLWDGVNAQGLGHLHHLNICPFLHCLKPWILYDAHKTCNSYTKKKLFF